MKFLLQIDCHSENPPPEDECPDGKKAQQPPPGCVKVEPKPCTDTTDKYIDPVSFGEALPDLSQYDPNVVKAAKAACATALMDDSCSRLIDRNPYFNACVMDEIDGIDSAEETKTAYKQECELKLRKQGKGYLVDGGAYDAFRCHNSCSGNGNCVAGRGCVCNNGYTGPDCSVQSGNIRSNPGKVYSDAKACRKSYDSNGGTGGAGAGGGGYGGYGGNGGGDDGTDGNGGDDGTDGNGDGAGYKKYSAGDEKGKDDNVDEASTPDDNNEDAAGGSESSPSDSGDSVGYLDDSVSGPDIGSSASQLVSFNSFIGFTFAFLFTIATFV